MYRAVELIQEYINNPKQTSWWER